WGAGEDSICLTDIIFGKPVAGSRAAADCRVRSDERTGSWQCVDESASPPHVLVQARMAPSAVEWSLKSAGREIKVETDGRRSEWAQAGVQSRRAAPQTTILDLAPQHATAKAGNLSSCLEALSAVATACLSEDTSMREGAFYPFRAGKIFFHPCAGEAVARLQLKCDENANSLDVIGEATDGSSVLKIEDFQWRWAGAGGGPVTKPIRAADVRRALVGDPVVGS
ncbi:MAG TPA: hypothetical protein VEK14_00030, partial [Rhodomicrobium sp.]|nr:hypothetical protein [Rhodomicrobium sp.]